MIPKKSAQELVLYYTPEQNEYVTRLKGVLVRMGIRIRNVPVQQVGETVGALAGMPGFVLQERKEAESLFIPEQMLVMHRFTSRRMDELLMNLRKAGVPKIGLKAVITPANCSWSFYHLYEEIREEHEKMNAAQSDPKT